MKPQRSIIAMPDVWTHCSRNVSLKWVWQAARVEAVLELLVLFLAPRLKRPSSEDQRVGRQGHASLKGLRLM